MSFRSNRKIVFWSTFVVLGGVYMIGTMTVRGPSLGMAESFGNNLLPVAGIWFISLWIAKFVTGSRRNELRGIENRKGEKEGGEYKDATVVKEEGSGYVIEKGKSQENRLANTDASGNLICMVCLKEFPEGNGNRYCDNDGSQLAQPSGRGN